MEIYDINKDYSGSNIEEIEISEEEITKEAFKDCKALKKVVLKLGVKIIGYSAFNGCESLSSITIPNSVEEIRNYAFSNCSSLESITLSNNIDKICDGTFNKCQALKDITIPSNVKEIGSDAFSGCKALKTVVMETGVEYIGYRAFTYCQALTEITFPDSINRLGRYIFKGCDSLENIEVDPKNPSFCSGDGVVFSKDKSRLEICPPGKRGEYTVPELVSEIQLYSFCGCSALTSVVIPESVDRIVKNQFDCCSSLKRVEVHPNNGRYRSVDGVVYGKNTNVLTLVPSGISGEFSVPDGVTMFDSLAFQNCSLLTKITFPSSVKEIVSYAFKGCDSLGNVVADKVFDAFFNIDSLKSITISPNNENFTAVDGVIFTKDMKTLVYLPRDKADNYTIPEGVECIEASACGRTHKDEVTIILPTTIRTIKDQNYKCKLVMPEKLPQMTDKLSGDRMFSLITHDWKPNLTKKDLVSLYLFQTSKQLTELLDNKNPAENAEIMLNVLQEKAELKKLSQTHVSKAASYFLDNAELIDGKKMKSLYDIATAKKAKKAIGILAPYIESISEVPETSGETADKTPYDFLREKFNEPLLDNTFNKNKGNSEILKTVKLKNSDEFAPPFIVKCAIVPYLDSFSGKPKEIKGHKKKLQEVRIIALADEAAQLLDMESLQNTAYTLFEKSEEMAFLLPFARYASGKQIDSLISQMKKWEDWDTGGPTGRKKYIVAQSGMLLSDTREAMLYFDKKGLLGKYAEVRNTDADFIRDTVLAEFGLDKNGKKEYSLGTKTVVATLQKDLTLTLFDTQASKTIKSIPKRGTDPDLAAKAAADYSEMKKNIKKIVKTRNSQLFDDFLSGKSHNAKSWKSSYLNNPLLNTVAQLIVWNQGDKTFILTDSGVVDSSGTEYEISDNINIGVAHPIEMTADDINRWQNYFCTNDLKQPFEQIWEPVVAPETVKADRYAGCLIPFYRFRGKEKDGIIDLTHDYYAENSEYEIGFKDCKADVKRKYTKGFSPDINDAFEVLNFSFPNGYTRQVNHIVAYLDKVSVYSRILNDDVTIAEHLSRFTMAQITDFINLAIENNSNNCTALLLNYKNAHFTDFDPLDSFTLD